MTQGERVKIIRKEKELTLEKFGERLGVGKSAISNIESGARNLTDQMIISICREFNVRKEWLVDGTGEMFVPLSRDEQIEEFMGEVLRNEPNNFKKRLISVLAKLSEDEWEILEKKLKEIVSENEQ